ncbi:MAG: hypothetical protein ACYDAG_12240 [Chloroflexota bacterium]
MVATSPPIIERADAVWLEQAGKLWDARSNRTILDIVLYAKESAWQAFLRADASQRASALGFLEAYPPYQLDGVPFSLNDGIENRKMAMAGLDSMVPAAPAYKARVQELAAEQDIDVDEEFREVERCTRVLTPCLKVLYNGTTGFHPDAFKAAWSRRLAWYDAERQASANLGREAMETLDELGLTVGLVTGAGVAVRVYMRRKEVPWTAARKALENSNISIKKSKKRPAA